jgi:ribonuclease HII
MICIKKERIKDWSKKMETPTYFYEEIARGNGHSLVGGIDEAGRGPLAGPVVAACVVLPEDFDPKNIRDSKTLTVKQRYKLDKYISDNAISMGVGIIGVDIIDKINILQATKQAMVNAFSVCEIYPTFLIVDGVFTELPISAQKLVLPKADKLSVSVAAASIVAKCTRDTIMEALHDSYPMYNWAKNKGYGTKEHLKAIEKHGISPYHRKSFAPCQKKTLIFGEPRYIM